MLPLSYLRWRDRRKIEELQDEGAVKDEVLFGLRARLAAVGRAFTPAGRSRPSSTRQSARRNQVAPAPRRGGARGGGLPTVREAWN